MKGNISAKKIIKRKAILWVVVFGLAALAVLFTPSVKSKTKSYYSGDAVNYKNEIIAGSTNMGAAEIFKYVDGEIRKTAEIRSPIAQFSGSNDFYNLSFREEGGRLYVYLVDGRYLYKYDISNPSFPSLVKKEKDNSWDWFLDIGRAGDKIITIGMKGVKVWNNNLEIINSFNATNNYHRNIQLSRTENLLLNIDKNILKITDAKKGEIAGEADINVKEEHNRKIFIDELQKAIYLVDDGKLLKYDFNGYLVKNFRHISHLGYDADGLEEKGHFYFSDGYGVVKMDKETLKPLKWVYTTALGGGNGWAMRLKVVNLAGKEMIVVFNNSSILVLNDNLRLSAFARAAEKDEGPQESLFLAADKTRAPAGSLASLRGGGFAQNEELIINFANTETRIKSDSQGRFAKVIQIPDVSAGSYDIKITGLNSALSYNLGFYIE